MYDLTKFNAGPEWAEYLIANGWELTDAFFGGTCQSATLLRSGEKITYFIDDNQSSFRHFKVFMGKMREVNVVYGPNLEGDLMKFAFLCHSLGIVDLKDANLACKDQTGESIFPFIKSTFCTSTFEAKQTANEIFELATA